MTDRTIPLDSVFAWLGWSLAAAVELVGIVFHYVPATSIATLCAAAGATMHVRGFIADLARRERRAYELGRESVRSLR